MKNLIILVLILTMGIVYVNKSTPISADNCSVDSGGGSTRPMRQIADAGACDTVNYYTRIRTKHNPTTALARMSDSADMSNVTERDIRLSDPNKLMWVTEFTPMGQVVARYNIKGKVSSNQSQLTATEGAYCKNGDKEWGCATVKLPGDNGTYGEDEPGVFFFDVNDVFHQWNGLYSLSDAPELLTQTPIITFDLNAKPSSTADTTH